MSTTTHDRTLELLPWLVNGTLEADERREVEAHLASCPACRIELEATRQAFDVYAAHLPTAALTAYALHPQAPSWEVDGRLLDRSVAEAHLGSCAECRDEVELLRGGLAALGDAPEAEPAAGGVLPFAPQRQQATPGRGPAWLPAALAASLLVAIVSSGGWYVAHQRFDAIADLGEPHRDTRAVVDTEPRDTPGAPPVDEQRLDQMQAEITDLKERLDDSEANLRIAEQQAAALQPEPDAAAAPSRGPVIAPLFYGTLRSRGDSAVVADPRAGLVFQVPLPPAELEQEHDFAYRVTDPGGAVVRSGEPTLRRAEAGSMQDSYLSIVLDASQLPSGELVLEVLDAGDVVASTGFRVP